MINIVAKEDCCGCGACLQRCPKSCITLKYDNEGFLYPQVDESMCIHCNLCEKVCPVINQNSAQLPSAVYAAKIQDDSIRLNSSSGGVFSLLGEKIISDGGVVFGVCFNEKWQAVFDFAETIEQLSKFRGSKYVQANVGSCFSYVEQFLKKGRIVLFSGTSCQISGLKHFLRKDYMNLYTVDIICHGVPSPKIWDSYLNEFCSSKKISRSDIQKISFRDKKNGWKNFGLSITYTDINKETQFFYEDFGKNAYMKAFLSNTILRPSCYQCPAKSGKCGSDLTIADFWGINFLSPNFDDDKGVSAVLVKSEKGNLLLLDCKITLKQHTLEDVVSGNTSYEKSCLPNKNRQKFFKNFSKGKSVTLLVDKYLGISSLIKIRVKLVKFLKRLLFLK